MNAVRAHPWVESFGSRELEVLQLISSGLSNREIAQELHLSIETIKWYNKQMFMKLGVRSRTQAVVKATELNLLSAVDGFPRTVPPHTKGNLPAQLTSFIGREKEIGEIKGLLKDNRLVMLTGAGGSGKTRLALKVCEELQDEFKDGLWLVELANVRETDLVLQTIASTLNIVEGADTALNEVLNRYLSQRQILLLIDNLEHLLDCAPSISELLANAPNLSILGTSREQLQIYGEQEYPVHPLDLPDLHEKGTGGDLAKVESIELFVRRARAFLPNLTLDGEALKHIARICVRLDGLPLAIELCAPLVKVFPLGVIADRIDEDLDTIPSGPRDLPSRQKSLHDTIQWSYDLLDENEKHLFIRLSIFNGGGTLQAVKSICRRGISGRIENVLSSLVNKNLVLTQERQGGEIHFSMLETIRQFGQDKLNESSEANQHADRHAVYFMKLAKQGAIELRGPNQIKWMDRFITMQDNMRIALEWVIESVETDIALRYICDLFEFWVRHADFEEAQYWLEEVMALPNAQEFLESYTNALNNYAWVTWLKGRLKEGRMLAEQALSLARSQHNKKNLAVALINLGLMLVRMNGDFLKGQTLLEESRWISEKIHAEWELALALRTLATAQFLQNKYSSARSLYNESFNLFNKLGDLHYQGIVKRLIGNLEIMQNNLVEGKRAFREALIIAKSVKNNLMIAYNIWELARIAMDEGNHARALRLYLASKKILENIGAWWSGDEPELEKVLATARAELGEAEFQSAVEAGQNMTMEEAIEFALESESK